VKKKGFRLEHQQPFSKGGSCRLQENIVLSCEICDKAKGAKDVEQFRQSLEARFQKEIAFYGESGRNLKLLLTTV
jgi:hypothetical protein